MADLRSRIALPPGLSNALGRFQAVPYANEITALVAMFVAMQLFPRGAPGLVYVAGGVAAAPLLLNAIGMILVFRANRFINFAQIQVGIFAATVFSGLVQGQLLLHTLHNVCSSCVGVYPGKTAQAINFVIAVGLGLLVAGLLGALVYVIVVRRFAKSPVLVSTIVTVFIAQMLAGFQKLVTDKLVKSDDLDSGRALRQVVAPWDHTFTIAGFPVHLNQLILVILAPLALVATVIYLRRSDTGAAIRASADNPSRASTLGVDVTAVTSRVWVIAGVLSGLAAILPAFIGGAGKSGAEGAVTSAIPISDLVVLLTIIVIARFANLWMLAAGALVLSALSTAVQLSFSSNAPLDALYVFLVGGLLLLQRDTSTRASREDFSGLEVTRELRGIPRELRNLEQVKRAVFWGRLIGFTVLAFLPFAISPSRTSLITDSFGLVIVGLSLLVLSGWAGQVSLGQFGFASIGAWTAAVSGLPFPLAILLGGLAGAVAAVVIGLPALKLRGLTLAVSTIAFAVSANALFIDNRYLGKHLPDSLKLPTWLGVDFSSERAIYYVTLLLVIVFAFVVIGLRRSRTGRALIAIRANQANAQAFGINVLRAQLTAFSISGFMAAVTGALLAFHLGSVAPQAFAPDKSLIVFLYTVVGGLGGIAGPMLGMGFYAAVNFIFVDNALIQYAGTGAGAVLLMMAAPGGLAQLVYGARDAMLRRLAFRLRIPVPSLMGDKGASLAAERVVLDEKREAPRRVGEPLPVVYKPTGQWALDRLGSLDGEERVGVR